MVQFIDDQWQKLLDEAESTTSDILTIKKQAINTNNQLQMLIKASSSTSQAIDLINKKNELMCEQNDILYKQVAIIWNFLKLNLNELNGSIIVLRKILSTTIALLISIIFFSDISLHLFYF